MTNSNPLQSENKTLPLFSTAYLPPIAYAIMAKEFEHITIETCEHYIKQSIRNRAYILSANGVLPIAVPVKRHKEERLPIEQIEIDYALAWQQNHLRAIRSAYGKTPYFEYYFPEIESILLSNPKTLFELNLNLTKRLFSFLGLRTKLSISSNYQAQTPLDFRQKFTKQNIFTDYPNQTYYQAFSNKFPFQANLSVIDLLFNHGPESAAYLNFIKQ